MGRRKAIGIVVATLLGGVGLVNQAPTLGRLLGNFLEDYAKAVKKDSQVYDESHQVPKGQKTSEERIAPEHVRIIKYLEEQIASRGLSWRDLSDTSWAVITLPVALSQQVETYKDLARKIPEGLLVRDFPDTTGNTVVLGKTGRNPSIKAWYWGADIMEGNNDAWDTYVYEANPRRGTDIWTVRQFSDKDGLTKYEFWRIYHRKPDSSDEWFVKFFSAEGTQITPRGIVRNEMSYQEVINLFARPKFTTRVENPLSK